MEKKILTVSDVAQLTGWSEAYIYRLVGNGQLKHSKPLGKTIFFDRVWIESFLLGEKEHQQQAS